jgi:hypothetical protein
LNVLRADVRDASGRLLAVDESVPINHRSPRMPTPQHRRRDIHFIDEDGMVACNPRDREAHRAEMGDIATTTDRAAVTCEAMSVGVRALAA